MDVRVMKDHVRPGQAIQGQCGDGHDVHQLREESALIRGNLQRCVCRNAGGSLDVYRALKRTVA